MATKKQVGRWIKILEVRRDAVGRERDKLAAVMDELSDLKECCDTAWDDLQRACDSLSELA